MGIKELQKKAARIRVDALTAIHTAGSGYTGSSMSVVEMLVALYYGEIAGKPVMNFDPKKPDWENQDYVILGKGHSAITQYSILADLGFIDKSDLNFFGQTNSQLQSRPSVKVPGITASIPSHGHGLSVACGVAMAVKMDRKDNKVFAVIGDGELQSGQVWEAAMAAAHYKLNNLILLIDNDTFQSDGLVRSVMDINPIHAKFDAFGWRVIQVTDGHDFDQILDAVSKAFTAVRMPTCILCRTIKGKGIDFAEGKLGYSNVPLSDAEMKEAIPKLKQIYE